MTTPKKIGTVISSSTTSILVEVKDYTLFEAHKTELQIGKFLVIEDGNFNKVISVIQNLKAKEFLIGFDSSSGVVTGEGNTEDYKFSFIIDTQPIGAIIDDKFKRGNISLPVPTEPVYLASSNILETIFKTEGSSFNFPLGHLSQNPEIEICLDGDKFFGKHVAIVGSTGSGKSCAVARILQNAAGISDNKNENKKEQKNSHIIIFDIHSEYKNAFSLPETESFNLTVLNVDNLMLPYWLMNAEELESLFIESNEQNSHNQVAIFKQAVILNKEKYNPDLKEVNYDTPVYFSIKEVLNYVSNMNREVVGKTPADNHLPKLICNTLVEARKEHYFDKIQDFVEPSQAAATKAGIGPFHGEFNRFVSRLETRLNDKRLKFLLQPEKSEGKPYQTEDFKDILRQLIGYLDKSNITIIDLSGIPFEVLSITVSLISRLIFDFSFHYSKLKHSVGTLNDVPITLVCEEAHNYIPRSGLSDYKSSLKSIERIAKEGRKYGLSLAIVSQRPSEVSETVLAQFNNFISLRLTNSNDQSYIRNLLPDSLRSVTDILPSLGDGECFVCGDSIILPSIVQLPLPVPEPEPHSKSVSFFKEWQQSWKDIKFEDVITRWRKDEADELNNKAVKPQISI